MKRINYNKTIVLILLGYLEYLDLDLMEHSKNYFILKKLLKRAKTKLESQQSPFFIGFYDDNRELKKQYIFTQDMSVVDYINNIDNCLFNENGFIKIDFVR